MLHFAVIIAGFLLQLAAAGWVVIRKGDRPSVALAWVVVVMTIPIAGVIAYLLLGEVWFGRYRMRRHKEILARLDRPEVHIHKDPRARSSTLSPVEQQLARLAESVSNSHATAGNRLSLHGDTDEMLDRMVEAIDGASHHVHLLTYIYLADAAGERIGDSLRRAAARGVKVRLMVDGLGSRAFLRSPLRRAIEGGGVQVAEALPVHFLRGLARRIDVRNHRKLLVVDGLIAFTGSQNIAAAGFAPKARYAPWVDCSVRIEGPLVRELQLIFLEDWFLDTNESLEDLLSVHPPVLDNGIAAQTVATGPNFNNAAMTSLVQAAVQVAREELVFTTPYFVPDAALHQSMAIAARRGVEVHLVVPQRNDSRLVGLASRSHYESLMDSGVHIHEFTRGLLHAKTITVDRSLAMVMTANLDRRSFEINFEQSVLIYDTDFASQLRFHQQGYMDQSVVLSPHAWRHRRWQDRLAQNAAGLLSPLL
ncbi:MAG: cardiolipin synthase [Phycisphaeraceae bacterium]|nr:cardiolipin synthase [Phycisphaeraceae bacterium]